MQWSVGPTSQAGEWPSSAKRNRGVAAKLLAQLVHDHVEEGLALAVHDKVDLACGETGASSPDGLEDGPKRAAVVEDALPSTRLERGERGEPGRKPAALGVRIRPLVCPVVEVQLRRVERGVLVRGRKRWKRDARTDLALKCSAFVGRSPWPRLRSSLRSAPLPPALPACPRLPLRPSPILLPPLAPTLVTSASEFCDADFAHPPAQATHLLL